MLEGNLSDFTLPDILRLLAFTTKTGRLHMEGDGANGRVDLVEGRIRDASADAHHLPLARRLIGLGHADGDTLLPLLEGRDTLPTDLEFARELVRTGEVDSTLVSSILRDQAMDAIFDLLRWGEGSFRFEMRTDVDTSPPDLDLKVDDVLAESDQRLDAWPGIAQRTGSGHAVVTISRPAGGTPDIDAEGWGLLALVDGHRTVDDLVTLSGRGQFETRSSLGRLVELGVITIGEAGQSGTVEKLIADHRALGQLEASLQHGAPLASPAVDADRPPLPQRERREMPDQPARPTEPSAERTAPPSWQQDVPSEPPQPPQPEPAPAAASDERRDGDPAEEPSTTSPAAQQAGKDEASALRMRVRSERLTTDPSVDADLVSRLIDGVEGL